MSSREVRPLDTGYSCEVDLANEQEWSEILREFKDSNIYQTWQYANVIAGSRRVSNLVLKFEGCAVAIALARVKRIPGLPIGIAYVFWGPLWQREGAEENPENFRQAVRALRNEFLCRRGLTLRLFPIVYDDDSATLRNILEEEGLSSRDGASGGRTILMDLTPSLAELRDGMFPHWKRELKVAEKAGLQLMMGTNKELFTSFIGIYKEMVSRKRFAEPNDIYQFEQVQMMLPEQLKMRVLLCRSDAGLCSGAIYSVIGNSAIYLFGATSNIGMKSRGSYFLQWKIIEKLKQQGVRAYNLNGINPEENPGTYKFKYDLAGKNGRDVFYLGKVEEHPSPIGHSLIQVGEVLRESSRNLKRRIKEAKTANHPGS
jgi:FemAB family